MSDPKLDVVSDPKLDVVTVRMGAGAVRFALADRNDHVQQTLAKGNFYEPAQLVHHLSVIPQRCVILDIGANIGNHTVFYSKFSLAERIIPVEPMPQCVSLLRNALELNQCHNVDTRFLGYGCGARQGTMYVGKINPKNWAATSLSAEDVANSGHPVSVITGDEIAAGLDVFFIKIDVEGMELEVLSGLTGTIARLRPTISIEVRENFEALFKKWRIENKYRIDRTFQDYKRVRTYLIFPD